MKKIVASVGLVALSAATLNAAYTQGLTELETQKPWSVGLTLRGFYDDNIEATHSDEIDSLGYEVNPWVGVHWVGDQTLVGASYAYSGKYYDETRPNSDDHWSHSHMFDLSAQHAFSPRYNLAARDSFAIGQEPDLLRSYADNSVPNQHISGDNIRNYGSIVFNAQLTKVFGLRVSYANSFWDYDDHNSDFQDFLNRGASYSGTLDRIEHAPEVEARWQLAPQTLGLVGYRYRDVSYTGDELTGQQLVLVPVPQIINVYSDSRDFRTHYGYLGVEHQFRPDLFASLRAGVSYTDNYNDPNDTTGLGPYVTASLTYEQSADTTFGGGFSQDFSTTDQIGSPSDFVRGVDNSVAYLWVRHRLAPSLYISAQGTFQYSVYDGGGPTYDGETDMFLLGNVNLEYWFDKHLSAHIGYNIDYLDSDIPNRSYDRNRVYIGISATY